MGCLCALFANAQHPTERFIAVPSQDSTYSVPTDPWSLEGGNMFFVPSSDSVNVLKDVKKSFVVDLDLRSRGEYRNGYSALRAKGTRPTCFVNERARLTMSYEQKYLSSCVAFQHTEVWADRNFEKKRESVSFYEAWARLSTKPGLFLQVGRIPLVYDDERIFGQEDWSTSGYSHDALRVGYEKGMHTLHGIVAYNQFAERMPEGYDIFYDNVIPYKSMQAVWYHYGNKQSPLNASALFVSQVAQDTKNNLLTKSHTQTVGAWLGYDTDCVYAKAEGYYQMGRDSLDRRINAFVVSGRFGYRYPVLGTAEVGVDYYSGDKTTMGAEVRQFNPLYGSYHRFLGAMDYFVQGSIPYTGLWDFNASVSAKPFNNFVVNLDYHYFMLGSEIDKVHSQLGHEIDLQARLELTNYATLQFGYSTMMSTSTMYYFKGGNNMSWQDWGWISLNVNPRVFTSVFRR